MIQTIITQSLSERNSKFPLNSIEFLYLLEVFYCLEIRGGRQMKEKKNALFSSRWGFILSAVGSAVGMANVWGFPAKLGANGGGAFLVAYLLFVALFSVVGLSAEYAIGRRSRTGTLGSYRKAWASRKQSLGKAGGLLGWLPLAGSLCIALGYAVIISYVLKAFFHSVTGELMHVNTDTWFDGFSTANYSVVPFHIIVVVGTLLTLLLGAKSIEKSNKIMMPVFDFCDPGSAGGVPARSH